MTGSCLILEASIWTSWTAEFRTPPLQARAAAKPDSVPITLILCHIKSVGVNGPSEVGIDVPFAVLGPREMYRTI